MSNTSNSIHPSTDCVTNLIVELTSKQHLLFRGRQAWALRALYEAGSRGITFFTVPAPRWSQYVSGLRSRAIEIETIREPNSGPFRGTHARYILKTPLKIIEQKAG